MEFLKLILEHPGPISGILMVIFVGICIIIITSIKV